ncbi:MAG: hypothetical protein JXO44_05675 [Clostridia bacterium]|nr:hypothetical protein [Clostridia bacterium]
MTYTFQYQQRFKLVALLIWCIVLGTFVFVSIEETRPYKETIQQSEVPVYQTDGFDMTNYLERNQYERALWRYHSRLARTFLLASGGMVGLFYILRPRKIVASEEGISLYSVFRRKPSVQQPWMAMKAIHIGAGTGIHGLVGSTGIRITTENGYGGKENVYIATRHYHDADQLHDSIKVYVQEETLLTYDVVISDDRSTVDMLKAACSVFKTHYRSYYIYSGIFSIFMFLQQYFKSTMAGMIAIAASVYFGYRALGALYHQVLCDHIGEDTDFDTSWAYAKTQIGRLIGASIVQEMGVLLCAIAFAYIAFSELPELWTYLSIGLLATIGAVYGVYFFLLPYIAGILDKEQSFMAANTQIVRGVIRPLLVLSLPGFFKVFAFGMMTLSRHDDVNAILMMIQKGVYVNLALNFLLMPFYAACAMYLLKALPMKNEVGGDGLEEVL